MAPGWRLCVALWLLALVALAAGQVTFSRDWSGGKRSPPAFFDCGQFARICRHFLHELRSAMSAGAGAGAGEGGHAARDDEALRKADRYEDDE